MTASRIAIAVLTAITIVSCLSAPNLAHSQHMHSFSDANKSKIDFRKADLRNQRECAAFRSLTTPNFTIISARLVAAEGGVPEHCRLHGVIGPAVKFWILLPSRWNGRFYMHGNGGYAGHPFERHNFAAAAAGLRNGFATAYTDTGHDSRYEPLGTFAYNEIQKTLDYSYRAVHLTAVTAKELIDRYYGRLPAYSYFDGCSTGGRQGLMEAQRFPQDFDGIVAGAPVNDHTNLHIWMAWIYQALEKTPITARRVLDIIAPNVLRVCDGLDGAKDGLVQNPEQCPFDPSKDLPVCDRGGDDCFSPVEIETLKRIYGPVMSNGKKYFPGLQVGAEPAGVLNPLAGPRIGSGWQVYVIDENGGPGNMKPFADTFFRYFAFPVDDPKYDWRNLNFDKDLDKMDDIRIILDAVEADMSAFKNRGGKIVSYHGWADGGPPAAFSVKYYNDVVSRMGERETGDFYRLFMVPGMFHCRGGFGPDKFDPMTAVINWVERGDAPDSIHAEQLSDGKVVRSRPLCPYPQISKYKGSGDMNDANNFVCAPR
jgi:hypothetical protein